MMSPPPIQTLFASRTPRRSEYHALTPRTPHSRSGRAEEGFTDLDIDHSQEEDDQEYTSYKQQQSEPLLASSTGSAFGPSGYRSQGDDNPSYRSQTPGFKEVVVKTNFLQNIPLLLGSFLALMLFALAFLSMTSPDKLDHLVGYVATVQEESDNVDVAVPTPSIVVTMPLPGHLISYENYTTFPLSGAQYLQECNKLMGGFMHHKGSYWDVPAGGPMDVPHHDDVTNYHLPEGERTSICSKTITYQLDGHVGLLADLAIMAQVAGLARERNRTFLVDDTYWTRGKWTDHFQDVRARQPGPEPGCRAPPPEELVACPRQARHWVINSRTAKFHLGHPYLEEYQNPYGHEMNRMKPIFERALESFETTIRPNAHNAELIRAARAEVATTLSIADNANNIASPPAGSEAEVNLRQNNPDPYLAVHIRRGDRKAGSPPHYGDYVPIDEFTQAARDTWARLFSNESTALPTSSAQETHFPSAPITYVASDSEIAFDDFTKAFPTSSAIFSLHSSTDPALRALASRREYAQKDFDAMPEEERIRLTRGMIVDLAMVSGLWAWKGEVVPGATICTLSSNICRIAAIGLGWDRAFGFGNGKDHYSGDIDDGAKRWIDLDNKGVVSPEWTAFELF
ncbi:hypothetical protein K474DRAFT_1618467 [Panus rudis PR-1116 ss-1]|nr:hypothetical protein K474DRAFT_1618467 [Panus rudis PR-1116 ss-1]